MTKRFAHIQKLVEIRRDVYVFPDATDRILLNAIIQALPPSYHKVYDWICQGTFHGKVETSMVMRAWNLKANHASTMLNELWRFGLLKRTERIDKNGKTYVYEVE